MAGDFFLRGLNLVTEGVTLTPREQVVLEALRGAARQSDAIYYDFVASLPPNGDFRRGIEELKNTLRVLKRAPILQAHYDREPQVQRPISPDGPLPDGQIFYP